MSIKRLGNYLKSEELDPISIHWQPEPAMGKYLGMFAQNGVIYL